MGRKLVDLRLGIFRNDHLFGELLQLFLLAPVALADANGLAVHLHMHPVAAKVLRLDRLPAATKGREP